MTDPVNPFNEPNPTQPPKPGEPQTESFVDQLNAIQNENGEQKYKDIPTALAALGHSQQHITTLETDNSQKAQELSTLREELASKKSVEDFVSQLTNKQDPPSSSPNKEAGLDAQAVSDMIARQFQEANNKTSGDNNLQGVLQKLNELYGDKAGEIITSKATEFGTTASALETMSRENPAMAIAILSGGKVSAQSKPTSTSVNSRAQTLATPAYTKPEKSVMRGATGAEVADVWSKIRDDVHQKFNVENFSQN
ncbi:MAG: hypothetical protein GQ574_14610 [Crocinitomix sp.]|nr:hypothetical protein [Crocinitomix sp.]